MNIKDEFIITKDMVKGRIEQIQSELNLYLEFEDNMSSIEASERISQLVKFYFELNHKKKEN